MYTRGIGTHKRQVHFMKVNIVTKVTSEFGKDLSECKRPGPKLYTEQDLRILLEKLCRLAFNEDISCLFSCLDTDRRADEMIADFERRFKCKFSDAKKTYPHIKQGSNNMENSKFIAFAEDIHSPYFSYLALQTKKLVREIPK